METPDRIDTVSTASRSPRCPLLLPGFLLILLLLPCSSVAAGQDPPDLEEGEPSTEAGEVEVPPILTGRVSRDDVETAHPEWVQARLAAEVDPAAAEALSEVEPGAEVEVFLGTWCSDSQRELSGFWRALDEVGGRVPFATSYVAVGEAKVEPAELTRGVGLFYVPTFIVRRNGEEVGRIVEAAPNGIVHDLLSLLTGEATGNVSIYEGLPWPPAPGVVVREEDEGGTIGTGEAEEP